MFDGHVAELALESMSSHLEVDGAMDGEDYFNFRRTLYPVSSLSLSLSGILLLYSNFCTAVCYGSADWNAVT